MLEDIEADNEVGGPGRFFFAGDKPIWEFSCEDEIRGSAAYFNGIVYVGSYDNKLYAIKASSGDFLWKFPTDGGIVSKPVVYDGNIYFGSEDRRLHVVSQRSGKVVWTYYADGAIRSSPVIAENKVYLMDATGVMHIVASDKEFKLVGESTLGEHSAATPAFTNGRIYIRGVEHIYCFGK